MTKESKWGKQRLNFNIKELWIAVEGTSSWVHQRVKMKLLLLVAFVAACTASSLVRSRTVSTQDDGSILITNSFSGRRVQIYKPTEVNGQSTFEINVAGPNFPSKIIRIYEGPEYGSENEVGDEVRQKRSFSKVVSSSSGDVFFLILKDYVGPVTDSQWDKFLTRVQSAVRQGVVAPEIYDLLVGLDFVEANYIWQAIQNGEQVFGQYQQGSNGNNVPFFRQNFYQAPSQYYQRQGFYQYQGPFSSQYYQGQYPYYSSQYQGPYSSQYYQYFQGQYPFSRSQYSQYFQGQYPYYSSQFSQGLFNNQYYQGQFPYYRSQYQAPLNSQYYQRQYLANNDLNVNQQYSQEVPASYSR